MTTTGEAYRNFKDFLLQYNRISENCFFRCINTFGQRDMTIQEIGCAEACVKKYTQVNFKVMSTYVEVQPQIVQKRIDEMNLAQTAATTNADGTQTQDAGNKDAADISVA